MLWVGDRVGPEQKDSDVHGRVGRTCGCWLSQIVERYSAHQVRDSQGLTLPRMSANNFSFCSHQLHQLICARRHLNETHIWIN